MGALPKAASSFAIFCIAAKYIAANVLRLCPHLSSSPLNQRIRGRLEGGYQSLCPGRLTAMFLKALAVEPTMIK